MYIDITANDTRTDRGNILLGYTEHTLISTDTRFLAVTMRGQR